MKDATPRMVAPGAARIETRPSDPIAPRPGYTTPSADPQADPAAVRCRRRHRCRLTDVAHQEAWSEHDISRLTTMSVRLLQRLLASGRMPRPDLNFSRRRLWRPATIRQWLDKEASK
jgi:hypothetical protein